MFDMNFFDTIYDRKNTGSIKYKDIRTESPHTIIPMWIADMDFQSPPAVAESLMKAAQHGIYGYGETDEEYDALLIHWYAQKIGWEFSKDQMINTPSVMFGIAAGIRALTEPGDAVLICQPVYYPFEKIITANRRKTVVSELVLQNGKYGIDFSDFENKIKQNKVKVFLLCSPHNPVGRVWTECELAFITQICERNGVYIISDEIHSAFIYPGHKHLPIASLSPEFADRTVTCLSPTKTFNLAGLQAAHIVVPDKVLRERIKKECAATGYSDLNIMAVTAAKAAYKYGDEWLAALLLYLQKNISLLTSAFSENDPITALAMEGTYLAWLDCRKLNLSTPALNDFFLNQACVWLHNGNTFGIGGQGFMRMNIACPYSVLETAIEHIKNAVNNNESFAHFSG